MPKKEGQLSGVKEIARRAKVSIGTVDRVLHNRNGVSPKTRDKIKAIIKDLDYQPNLLARRLASKRAIRIATLIPAASKDSSFWSLHLQGILKAEAELKKYNIIVNKYFFDLANKASFISQTRKILREKPDGVMLSPYFVDESVDFTSRCSRQGIPFVFIDSDIEGQNSLSYVGPHSYNSGYLAANLVSYILRDEATVLVLNISQGIHKYDNLLRKEEGFRAYFTDHSIHRKIEKIEIRKGGKPSIEREVTSALVKNRGIHLVFVTNSRVSVVAQCLRKIKKRLILIGYDAVEENIGALLDGDIDFLICQRPGEQAYKGVISIFQFIVLNASVDRVQYMPIDIITRENYRFYKN